MEQSETLYNSKLGVPYELKRDIININVLVKAKLVFKVSKGSI